MDNSGLQMAPMAFVVPLLQAAAHYRSNLQRRKGDFPAVQFYRAAMRYLNKLSSLFSSIGAANANAFPKDGFAQVLAAEV